LVENAFSDFNGLEMFFLSCALIGGFFVVVKLVMQFALGGHNVDVDQDIDFDTHHVDSDIGFKILSLHGFSSFLMMFGLVGLALYRQSQAGLYFSIVGAVIAGVLSVWIIGNLFKGAARLQSSGTLDTAGAIGSSGTVYLTIPENGTGRVSISYKQHLREFDATSKDGRELPSGTPIHVIQVKANVLIVEPLR